MNVASDTATKVHRGLIVSIEVISYTVYIYAV
jgi:hypothetical protein